ncbi:P-loop containing nucleoside triphosphate hydrolase protein [Vararia minispora EC-137]|uniref:P-loop containing nucleoside triphosphate hydrolase protein n=1 Tax=Vararia minispora EC-137 TaxID=1314806 RepID=A0ACB8QUY8_9AGAM|nr:P-loop containing nucleoside triphosphate hydrolase protein [Vararia minispora EC-137]
MGKIRKKTSKRGTTHRRKQIQNKVRESRKKAKKEAKSPQWKSKKPKDPGIPNSFPYKDQILAEIAEERRKDKRVAKAQAKTHTGNDEDVSGPENDDKRQAQENSFDAVATLHHATTSTPNEACSKTAAAAMGAENVPLLQNPDWPHLQAVLKDADACIEILDARDPFACRLVQVEKLLADTGKKLLFVLNKIDSCPRETVAAWAAHLRRDYPTALFRSASAFLPVVHDSVAQKGKGKAPVTDAWGVEAIQEILGQWAQEKGDMPLKVAVIGWINTGKSSFINSLLGCATLPIYVPSSSSADSTTTTTYAVGLSLVCGAHTVTLIDTPGLSPSSSTSSSTSFATRTPESEAQRAADALIRSRGRLDRIHDPLPALSHIVSRFEALEDIMLFYNLPAFAQNDPDAFLAALARAQGLIRKKGVLDKTGAARVVLRDWTTGKLPRVAVPPSPGEPAVTDMELLARLKTRAEMRKGSGFIRLAARPVDDRTVGLSAPWVLPDACGDEDEGEEGVEYNVDEESYSEEDDHEDDQDEDVDGDEVSTLPPLSSKRKAALVPSRPVKKVAFDLPAKGGVSKPVTTPKKNDKPGLAKKKMQPPKRAVNAPKKTKGTNAASPTDDDAYSFSAYFR